MSGLADQKMPQKIGGLSKVNMSDNLKTIIQISREINKDVEAVKNCLFQTKCLPWIPRGCGPTRGIQNNSCVSVTHLNIKT